MLALLAFGAGIATTEPAAIEAKRAEVSRIQAELDSINGQVEQAAEAYNGARYELGQVTDRIDANERQSVQTQKDLVATRQVLSQRLRALYASPDPSLIEVLIDSGSITAAADQMQLLDRIGQQDAQVVGGLRVQKARLAELKVQLEKDRATAAAAVQAREREKARVESLLSQRQQVLDGASADLRQMIAAEKERERQEAAAQARLAQQRAAAASASAATAATPVTPAASSGGDPAASSGSSGGSAPSTPLPSGSGNAAAASVAMQYLGVPYVWGGASPSGFDCSGLASYAYAQIGKSVPHYTGAIWAAFPKVPSDQLEPGDMVFFNGLGHMGIYIGGGQYVHAPHTGDVVKVSSLGDRSDYVGAVRP
ncbi:MAG TPA: NlpC/P60 family protein [Miltoncostaeaceae bacterium]|nr:NlpC/P60 family protein [Miltoncostaeaceae bacterium]